MADYLIHNGNLYNVDELCHYGVVGMKWGVRRANRKSQTNEKLRKKALTYDKKVAALTKKAEKAHAKYDLERANKNATKSADLNKKAAKLSKKALNTDSELSRAIYERRSEKLKYKATKLDIKGDRLSKTKGYGSKAMKYSVKSDEVARKAAKARYKIANNKAYIEKMNRKVSTISPEDLKGAYAFVEELKRT